MGIPGLTTFINKHCDYYLESIELHDTYLVIDGNSIACQLHSLYVKSNNEFGGDYDKYAHCVAEWFDELLKCNITPLVLFDGGIEDKKLKTVMIRAKQRIKAATLSKSFHHGRVNVLPLLLKRVFKDVLIAKSIRFAQCLFEADNSIAAIARTLNCPVLSFDSDFYIYDVLYIPFDTLKRYVVKNSERKSYAKPCKIFRVENLLKRFRGLDRTLLPLAAVLLGNDYIRCNTFRNFFNHLKFPKVGKRKHNEQQCRIEATLKWVSQFTLHRAITEVLSRLPVSGRKTILNKIESIIEGYTSSSVNILLILGFSKEYISQITSQGENKGHKFVEDVRNLPYIEEQPGNDSETSDEENSNDLLDVLEDINDLDNRIKTDAIPSWFLQDFNRGKFSTYLLDMITQNLCILPIQIEDSACSSSAIVSFKIIAVIYKLLTSGLDQSRRDLQCVYRKERCCMVRRTLEIDENILDIKLPPLARLPDIPLANRREFLNKTLDVDERQMNGLPPEWMLYIAAITYWVKNTEEIIPTNCHLYSLLFSTLKSVIDRNVGFFRTVSSFNNKYDQRTQQIKQRRSNDKYQPSFPIDVSVVQAYQEIDTDDCILAAPFFILNSDIDDKLIFNSKKFNIAVVHAFSEFQNCLNFSMDLNALLRYPYLETKVADILNGTLFYNLHANFQKRNDVQDYIATVLKNSPSLLRFFNVLLFRLQPVFSAVLANKVNRGKRRKHNKKTKEENSTSVEEKISAEEEEEEDQFYDENNIYTLLGSI